MNPEPNLFIWVRTSSAAKLPRVGLGALGPAQYPHYVLRSTPRLHYNCVDPSGSKWIALAALTGQDLSCS